MTTFQTWEEAKQYAQNVFEDYLRKRGINTKKNFLCLNPAHADKHPSMSFDQKRKRVHCFSCGADYDIFSLIGVERGLSGRAMFEETFHELGISVASRERNMNSLKPVKWQPTSHVNTVREAQKQPEPIEEKITVLSPRGLPIPKYYEDVSTFFTDEVKQQFQAYMQRRGISEAIYNPFPIGYAPAYPVGEKTYPAVIFFSAKLDTYEARIIDDTGKAPRYLEPKGGKHFLFNEQALDGTRPVFVVEGCFDALSIMQVGCVSLGLTSIANINDFKNAIRERIDKRKAIPPLILALDSDEAGQKSQHQLAEELAKMPEVFAHAAVDLYLSKDANDAITSIHPEEREIFYNAVIDLENFVKEQACREKEERIKEYEEQVFASNFVEKMIAEIDNTKVFSPTGFDTMDSLLGGGLYAGIYVIGAESSLGKTTFCLQIADQISAQGTDVLFFSLEMSMQELMAKSVSRLSSEMAYRKKMDKYLASTTRQILTGALRKSYKSEAVELLKEAFTAYKEKVGRHICIREGIGSIGVDEIHQAVAEHMRITGRRPLVIIDYLQIMKPVDMRASDKQNTDRAMLALKQFSRDEDLPIIAISSFNRENYNAPVSMASFKESGAIEYSSDVLLGLQYWGSEYKDGESENERKKRMRQEKEARREEIRKGNPAKVELKILKNRNGRRGDRLLFDYYPAYNRFVETPWGEPVAPRDVDPPENAQQQKTPETQMTLLRN